MVDFILLCFMVAVFAGGFLCGKMFGSFGTMFVKAKATVRSWL